MILSIADIAKNQDAAVEVLELREQLRACRAELRNTQETVRELQRVLSETRGELIDARKAKEVLQDELDSMDWRGSGAD